MPLYADVAGAGIDFATPVLLFYGALFGAALAVIVLMTGAFGNKDSRGTLWALGAFTAFLNAVLWYSLRGWSLIPPSALLISALGVLVPLLRRERPPAPAPSRQAEARTGYTPAPASRSVRGE